MNRDSTEIRASRPANGYAGALSPESERKLLREYRLAGCLAARNRLLELLSADLESLLFRMFPGHPSQDDLFQDACLALIESIDKYDLAHPARARLLTFVRKRLLGLGSSSIMTLEDHDDIDECGASLPSEPDESLECVSVEEGRRLLVRILSTLSDRERDILVQRRSSNRALLVRELAAYYGVSSARIVQLEQRALRAARKTLQGLELATPAEEGLPT